MTFMWLEKVTTTPLQARTKSGGRDAKTISKAERRDKFESVVKKTKRLTDCNSYRIRINDGACHWIMREVTS